MPVSGKRIAFDARYINDRYHGIGRYAFHVLERLTKLYPREHFIVYRGRAQDTRFDWRELLNRPNVEVKTGPWPLYWPVEQFIWPSTLNREKADLFYSPYIIAPLLARGIPTIITVHDLLFDRYPEYMPHSWSRPYYRFMLAQGLKTACKVIAVSSSTADDLRRYYGIPEAKLEIIPEGVAQSFQPVNGDGDLQAIQEAYHLENPYLLTVGVRRPHKNFSTLVEAFALLAGDVPHNLVFVGPADSRFSDKARQTTVRLGLERRVRFLNWVPEEHLAGLYTLADGIVLPSLMEGFGLPALEAMACGTPVIASESTSYQDIVGQAGLLVDPRDSHEMACAIEILIRDPELRRRLSAASLVQASQFTWDRVAHRLQRTFEGVFDVQRGYKVVFEKGD